MSSEYLAKADISGAAFDLTSSFRKYQLLLKKLLSEFHHLASEISH
jgi:hypothetical protein